MSCRLLSGNPTIFSMLFTTSSTDMFSLTLIRQMRFPTSALMMNSSLYPLASLSYLASSLSSIPNAPPSLLPLRYGFRLLMRLISLDFCMRARCSLMPVGTTSGQAGTGCALNPCGNSSCSSMTMVLYLSRSGRGGAGLGSRQREAASSERGLSSGSNLHCLNSCSMRLRASRFLRQVWTSWSRKSWWLRSVWSASLSSLPAISLRYPSTTERMTLKKASSSRSRSLRNLPLNSMNLKKMLLRRASVWSAGRAPSSSVTRMSNTSPVGTQSSPKFISFSTRHAFTMGSDCLPTERRDSCRRAHSSKVQQPFSVRFCCCRMTSFSSSGFTLRTSYSAINIITTHFRSTQWSSIRLPQTQQLFNHERTKHPTLPLQEHPPDRRRSYPEHLAHQQLPRAATLHRRPPGPHRPPPRQQGPRDPTPRGVPGRLQGHRRTQQGPPAAAHAPAAPRPQSRGGKRHPEEVLHQPAPQAEGDGAGAGDAEGAAAAGGGGERQDEGGHETAGRQLDLTMPLLRVGSAYVQAGVGVSATYDSI